MIEEALRRIQVTKNEKLHYIDLSDLGLKTIPEEILEIPWLQVISLSRNALTNIDILEHLPKLHKLALTDNQITDISILEKLPKLRFIFLANNQVTDISPLINIPRLKKLVLHNNLISKLPDLSKLSLLAYLDLLMNPLQAPSVNEIKTILPVLRIYKV